jgi:hypothetical protein
LVIVLSVLVFTPKDTKEVIRGINTRTDNTMAMRKGTKGQTIIYKKLHRKLKIEQQFII